MQRGEIVPVKQCAASIQVVINSCPIDPGDSPPRGYVKNHLSDASSRGRHMVGGDGGSELFFKMVGFNKKKKFGAVF